MPLNKETVQKIAERVGEDNAHAIKMNYEKAPYFGNPLFHSLAAAALSGVLANPKNDCMEYVSSVNYAYNHAVLMYRKITGE